ncbi:MAG: hypothetical protein PHW19_12295 [Salinivirgaceae bacterium]|nr:hypothetical protein [Salinivirgaceae bacterium]
MAISQPIDTIKTKKTLVFTGTIYDLTTSNVGIGLNVTACIKTADDLTEIKTVTTDFEGNYFISIESSELMIGEGVDITFVVRQKGFVLEMESIPVISVTIIGMQHLVDLNVFSIQTIKSINGTLKRKNGQPASFCAVELFVKGNDEGIGLSMTNIYGYYEIFYNFASISVTNEKSPLLKLKFYNNEEITNDGSDLCETSQVLQIPYSEAITNSSRNKNYATKPYLNDIEIENSVDSTTKKVTTNYFLIQSITPNGATWDTVQKLLYVKIFDPNVKIDFWRIDSVSKILEKRVVFSTDNGKTRTTYTKAHAIIIPTTSGTTTTFEKSPLVGKVMLRKDVVLSIDKTKEVVFDNVDKYIKTTDNYKPSLSPYFTTSRLVETINFKFTKDSIDLYTRLTNRLGELQVESELLMQE